MFSVIHVGLRLSQALFISKTVVSNLFMYLSDSHLCSIYVFKEINNVELNGFVSPGL